MSQLVCKRLYYRYAMPKTCSDHALQPQLSLQGLAPNYVKVVPSIAITFVTYEQVKEMLGVEFRISE
jgi:hypothetical protein